MASRTWKCSKVMPFLISTTYTGWLVIFHEDAFSIVIDTRFRNVLEVHLREKEDRLGEAVFQQVFFVGFHCKDNRGLVEVGEES